MPSARHFQSTGNSFAYRCFPAMPHSMHGHGPAAYVKAFTDWLADLP
ncbi:hypothetical protein ACWD9K_34665 [Streptomyces sp. 900116325]